LTTDTVYYFRVIATGVGYYLNSGYSSSISAIPIVQTLITPTGVTASVKNASALTVRWNAVTNASGYTIQYATDADFTQNEKTQNVTGGTIPGLTHQLAEVPLF
jgi:hypothetical protein